MPEQGDNVIDQDWGDEYNIPTYFEENSRHHDFEKILLVDTRTVCKIPIADLKEWQTWLSREATVFELAKRIVVNNDYTNVLRMTRVLTFHYVNLIRKRFPANVANQFRENITLEGNYHIAYHPYCNNILFMTGIQTIKDIFTLKYEALTKFPDENSFIPSDNFLNLKYLTDQECAELANDGLYYVPVYANGEIIKQKKAFEANGYSTVYEGIDMSVSLMYTHNKYI
jgi:hypothetical protein